MLLLPRDFIQACWLFRLLDKSAPTNQENVGENGITEPLEENQLENHPTTDENEGNEQNESDSNSLKDDCEMETEDAKIPAIVEITPVNDVLDDNTTQVAQVPKSPNLEAEAETEPKNDQDSIISDAIQIEFQPLAPVVTPLAIEAVDGIIQILVDLTKDMNLSQVEDIGVALSALAISSHQQSIHEVINVNFIKLINRFYMISPRRYKTKKSFEVLEIQKLSGHFYYLKR